MKEILLYNTYHIIYPNTSYIFIHIHTYSYVSHIYPIMLPGTQIAKGTAAIDACRTVPLFCITTNHFIPQANLPQCPPGRHNVDHIEMISRQMDESSGSMSNSMSSSMSNMGSSMSSSINNMNHMNHMHNVSNFDNLIVPSMTGGCRLSNSDGCNSSRSWSESWLTAGGCPLLLYLLQEYVRAAVVVENIKEREEENLKENEKENREKNGKEKISGKNDIHNIQYDNSNVVNDTINSKINNKINYEINDNIDAKEYIKIDYYKLVNSTIYLLATMIESSAEIKEQFIQVHGFHVISNCLIKIKNKSVNVNKELIDCCIELTLALGVDALKGE